MGAPANVAVKMAKTHVATAPPSRATASDTTMNAGKTSAAVFA
jgi:hypothetical protein